jgi:hypothetical protein
VDKKKQLLTLIARAHQVEMSFISEITDEERALSGTSQEWSIKDEIIHIAAWKGIMCERFRAFQADQIPPAYDDWDVVNEELFQRHRDDSWSEALDYLELTYSQLVEQIQFINEEDLMDPQRYPWLNGRSLWKHTLHNGYFHPPWHIALSYGKRGDPGLGSQLMEEVTLQMHALDDSSTWQGQFTYNLACFYALSGDKVKAIGRLNQAFSLNSDMVAWSLEDSDLVSIWDDPDYRALVKQWKSKK